MKTFAEYEKAATRTRPDSLTNRDELINAAFGLGESGEVQDAVKKLLFHGHDRDECRDKILDECGDVLWYLSWVVDACGSTLSDVAHRNIDKLKRRYPDGFSAEASINRKEQDQ